LRRIWPGLAAGSALICLGAVIASVVFGGWFGGFLAGFLVSWALVLPAVGTVLVSGSAPAWMGSAAERWASDDLGVARKAGWAVVDHIPMKGRDIDHAVIGPDQAYAIETKWSAKPWNLASDRRLDEAIRQARGSGRDLGLLLKSATIGHPVPVRAVLVLWGQIVPGGADLPIEIDGVTVIHGDNLVEYFGTLNKPSADEASLLAAAAGRMRDFCEVRDVHDAQRAPTR
jgi:hypothetical protein